MARKIIWSRNAIRDKIQILDYWYNRIGTKTYSKKLDKAFRTAVKNLKDYPFLGKKMEESDMGYIVKEHHLILYSVGENEIMILHIWDSRRNPEDFRIEE
ncbi:MAG: type II toxin-antitoxin system RelE/ParE family toxin [Bacteroidales bacterium]|nr:type II toxin-antitoxin system RelE/ParE family toxin [Bacteroidales bacterium]